MRPEAPVGGACDSRERLDGADDAGGERDEGGYELEGSTYGNADHAEGEQDQPDQRVEAESDERYRPAHDEEDAEDQKLHGSVPFPR